MTKFKKGHKINLGRKRLDILGDKNPAKRLEIRLKISLANKGRKFTKEHIKKIVEGRKGYKHSEETKRKMSENHRNYQSEETRRKLSLAHKGKKHSEKTKKILSNLLKKQYKKGIKKGGFEKGHKDLVPKSSRIKAGKKISLAVSGEKSPHWLGGKSFEPYGIEFNKELKEKIRQRDNYTCQKCGKSQKELKRKLQIHHIDYNKENNKEKNLISLCITCHNKTNFNRKKWLNYFLSQKKDETNKV